MTERDALCDSPLLALVTRQGQSHRQGEPFSKAAGTQGVDRAPPTGTAQEEGLFTVRGSPWVISLIAPPPI